MALVECLFLLVIVAYLAYKYSTSTFRTFEERGVPHKKPWPLIGNASRFLKGNASLHKIMLDLYKENKHHKVFGFYNFRNPFFIINDPEIIKKMAVKDFDTFANHQKFFSNDSDPILNGIITIMTGQRWKDMRSTITPAFTGAKLRGIFTLMDQCFMESLKYLHNLVEGKEFLEIQVKDCFYRLSNDIIATTAFGVNTNSFVDENNEFYTLGRSFSKTKVSQAIKFMLFSIAPGLCKMLGIKPLDDQKVQYFVRLVVDAMEYREKNHIVRPDMIQLLLEAKKENPSKWSQEDLVAQCFIFFFAAIENNSNLLCVVCQELMENPDIQEKLYEEIMMLNELLDGQHLDYETLKKMKFMDMVLSETLRKWSLAALMDRDCGRDYKVIDGDGNFICELKKGDSVWFHAIGLHWDEQYFEEPDKFKPERFGEANKKNINPFTYFPFGVGPRSCIGNRYALMQSKAMLYYLLKDFKVERSEKSVKNLMEEIRMYQIDPKDGFWFKFVPR